MLVALAAGTAACVGNIDPAAPAVAANAALLAAPGTPTATPTFLKIATAAPTDAPSATPTFLRFASPSATFVQFSGSPASATPLPTLARPTLAGPAHIPLAATPSPTLGPSPTPTLTPLPLLIQAPPFQDHFVMARPFDPAYTNWVSRNYPYGSTAGGEYRVHHGMDIMNETGTPVRAAADGTVIHAGPDTAVTFGPEPNFYGNVIVIQHDFKTATGLPVFSLYGHLSKVSVQAGQRVDLYDQIGLVGATGVANGAHLHFEVRAGDPFDYNAVRNPDLWIQNFDDFGVIAGRVTDAQGELIPDLMIQVSAPGIIRNLTTYAGEVPGDDQLDENFAIGDLPAGDYQLVIKYGGRTHKQIVTVYPERVNWVEIMLP